MRHLFLFLFLALGITTYAQTKSQYSIVNKIHLPGDGGWDYISIDSNGHLYVSHSSMVQIVDSKSGSLLGTIDNLNGVHGIALDENLHKGFISCGHDSSVVIFDLNNLKVLEKVKVTGAKTDAILFDPYSNKVFAFNAHSDNVTVLDAKTNQVIKTIQLVGNPEFAVTDKKGKIYVNIEHKSMLSCINAKDLTVEKTWPIAPGEEPSGLAADFENGKLFLVCANEMMIVFDLKTEKVVANLPTGKGTDGAAFDKLLKRVYSSNGEGTLTVVQEEGNNFKALESFKTLKGARTICVDSGTHHLFLPTSEFAPLLVGERRSKRIPGTFMVLDIAPNNLK